MPAAEFGIVLCAGLGVRLQPLTDAWPKPLLRFLDRPIASYAVDALLDAGVTSLGINAHQHVDAFRDFVSHVIAGHRDGGGGQLRAELVVESELMGTGGGALGIWRRLGSPRSTLVVVNGDIVTDFPIEQMLKVHRRTGAMATLLTRPPVAGEGAVSVDDNRHFIASLPTPTGQVESPRYKAAHPVTFGGVYVLEPEVFDALPEGNTCLIRRGVAAVLGRGELVAAYAHEGFWADVGTPARLLGATRAALEEAGRAGFGGLAPRASLRWVADPRSVHPSARIEPPVFIAQNAVIESGAVVGPWTVVGEGCVVTAGATIQESVLMHGARVEGRVHRVVASGKQRVRVT